MFITVMLQWLNGKSLHILSKYTLQTWKNTVTHRLRWLIANHYIMKTVFIAHKHFCKRIINSSSSTRRTKLQLDTAIFNVESTLIKIYQ